MDDHPGIVFRDGPTGRRAGLAAGPAVWEVIDGLEPSARGELEITDVNNWYVERGTMEYDVVDGFWGDAGESIDAYYAVNDFVRSRR